MKKRVMGFVVAVLVLVGISHGASHPSVPPAQLNESPASSQSAAPSTVSQPSSVAPTQAPIESTPVSTPAAPVNTGTTDSKLSNDNTYTNVDGTTVHSPAYSTDNSVPAGATAQCADGTYSFSQHRRGTCSYHGGVAEWL